jgi:DNA modification methylase
MHWGEHPLGKNPGDVWTINTQPGPPEARGKHFAIFPPKLVEPMIMAGCPPDGIVLDPFAGSGTTCVVAKKLGRDYIGIDIHPDYCEIARKRLENTVRPLSLDKFVER